ncbi:MAG: hypothetical protein O7B99_15590 [Planctomycetota bacterium]|nr:hypothetical protein [Planctomycetota bacterium]
MRGRIGLRVLLFGFLAGILLSVMRAPLGLDLMRLPAVDGRTAALFRAFGLIGIALVLAGHGRLFENGVPVASVLASAVVGYALHGLVLSTTVQAETPLGFVFAFALLVGGMFVVARKPGAQASDEAGDRDETATTAPGWIEWMGLVVAAAGAAVAAECLARHLRLFTLGLPEDHTVLGAVFLAALVIGAVAFGRPLASSGRAAAVLAAGLALGAGSCLVGLQTLEGWAGIDELGRYLRRFGLDLSLLGQGRALLLTGAAVLVVPDFLLGTSLAGACQRTRLAAVALGAAIGMAVWPFVAEANAGVPLGYVEVVEEPWAWRLVWIGTLLASAGAMVALARNVGKVTNLTNFMGMAVAVGAAVAVRVGPHPAVWPFSPWSRAPVEPELVLQTGDGMLTVERDRGGVAFVTLDRKRLSPNDIEEVQDEARLRYSWSLLDPELRASGRARVLFVGAMTPARAFVLGSLGEMRLDRTAPWFSAVRDVERQLFGGDEVPGSLIEPDEARDRLADGDYDLVVAPPVHGPMLIPKGAYEVPWSPSAAPATAGLSVPEGTIAVVWLDAASPIADRDLGERVILCSRGVDDLNVGMVLGQPAEHDGAYRPTILDPGGSGSRRSPLALVADIALLRADKERADLTARLADAAEGTPNADLALGLHRHHRVQGPSSPFETLAQQVELDDGALDALARAAAAGPLDPFLRQLWEGLAKVLEGKRMPDKVLTYVEPLARKHGPWIELERVVATAYMEFDMAAEAATWLERALESSPYDIGLLVACADRKGRAGDGAGEVELLRRALALQPAREDLKLLVAVALMRSGDPGGRRMARELLDENPEGPRSADLRELLESGPGPRPAPRLSDVSHGRG